MAEKDAEIKVLEGQIKALEEKINYQQKSLDENIERKVLEEQVKSLKKELQLRSESIEKRLNIYVTGISSAFVVIVSLLSFFGYRSIQGTVENFVEPKAIEVLERLEKELKEEGKESLGDMLAKLEKDESLSVLPTGVKKKPIEKDTVGEKVLDISQETRDTLSEYTDQLAQEKTEKQYSPEDWFYKGINSLDKADYPKAITYLSNAIKLNPAYKRAYKERAYAYEDIGKYKDALRDYSKVITLEPEYYDYIDRGYLYIMLKQQEKAIDDFTEAIKLRPDYENYYYRGDAYFSLKQYDKAVDDFKKSIDLGGLYAYEYLALVEIITDDYVNVLKTIEKSKSSAIGPENKTMLLYFECIARKLLNMETSESEAALDNIIKTGVLIGWNLDPIELWLKDAEVDNDKKAFIKKKTELIKDLLW